MSYTDKYNEVASYLNATIGGVALEHDQTYFIDEPVIDWELVSWHELDRNPTMLDDLMVSSILVNKHGQIERISEEEARQILLLNPFINEGEEPDWE